MAKSIHSFLRAIFGALFGWKGGLQVAGVQRLEGFCLQSPRVKSCEIMQKIGKKATEFWRNVSLLSSFNLQGKWPQKNSQKVLDIFHNAPNKVSSLMQLLGWGGPRKGWVQGLEGESEVGGGGARSGRGSASTFSKER